MDDTKKASELPEDESVKLWSGRVELARRFQERTGNTGGRWDKNIHALAGDFNSVEELGEEAIDVNLIRSTVKTVLPPLWITEPHVTVKPAIEKTSSGADNVRRAEITELELNYWLRELKVREQTRKVLLDAEMTNHGYLYLGWTKKDDVELDGERIEPLPQIRKGQPFVRRLSPKQVLVPPGFDDLEACPWVAISWLKPVCDVREKYGSRAEGVVATQKWDADGESDPAGFKEYLQSDDAKMVEIFNVWDKRTQKVYVLAKDHDQFLEPPSKWPVKVEGFPLVHYRPEEVPDEFYGTPPTSFILPQNKELNSIRTAMRKRRNRTKAVTFMDSEMARETAEAYKSAQDGEILPVSLNGEDIRGKMSTDPGLPMDGGDLHYDALVKGDIREQSGLSAEQRGGGDPNVDTATSSMNIERGVQVRGSDRADRIRTLYLTLSHKLWMILKAHPNVEVTRMIAGANNAEIVRTERYTLAELEGEFAFEMDFGAMLQDTPQTRVAQAMQNYNMFRMDPLIEPQKLILDVYKSQGKVDPQEYLLFLRSPQEEMELFMQGLPVEAHERDDHMSHMQAHDADFAKLDAAMDQVDPESEQGMKLRMATILGQSHMNDHARKLQRLQGAQGKQPGDPVQENSYRSGVKEARGDETPAEMHGNPMGVQ